MGFFSRCRPVNPWDFTRSDGNGSVGYVGSDAFRVPIQHPDTKQAEWRMFYPGVLYMPGKEQTEYVSGWDLCEVGARVPCGRRPRVLAEPQCARKPHYGLGGRWCPARLCRRPYPK